MAVFPSVVIAGCGDVGSRLGLQLLQAGWQVHGLRRNVAALPSGLLALAADLAEGDCPIGGGTLADSISFSFGESPTILATRLKTAMVISGAVCRAGCISTLPP